MPERPLSSIEAALTLTNRVYPLTAVVTLRLHPGPPPNALRQALDQAQRRHPMLHMRIREDRDGLRFVPSGTPVPAPLEVRERTGEQDARHAAEALLNRSIDPAREALLQTVYLVPPAPDGPADLVCAFHHAAMDAASACRLLHDLLAHCAALAGSEAAPPIEAKPLPLLPAADALLPDEYAGLGLARRLVPFLGRQMREEIRYRMRAGGGSRAPVLPPSPCRVHSLTLSPDETRALSRRSRRERATVHGALTAALLLAVYGRRYRTGDPLMRHVAFADLRPYLKPPVDPVHLGCYLSMLRIAVPVSGDAALWPLARSVDRTLHAANRRGDKFLSALLARPLMKFLLRAGNARMGDTALSYAGPLPFASRYGPIRLDAVHGFITPNRLSPELAAFGHLALGRLTLDLMVLEADFPGDEAARLTRPLRTLLTSDAP